MVRNAALFGERHFSRADIEMAVDLSGIADEDFAAEAFGKADSQRRFPRRGRPQNHDEPRARLRHDAVHPRKAQYRSRSASSTRPASTMAPAIWARFSFNGSRFDPDERYRGTRFAISGTGREIAEGSGSNGFDAWMEAIAALSSGSFPDVLSSVGSGAETLPSGLIEKVVKTTPCSPMRTDSGITASQLRCSVARSRRM